MLCPSMSWRLLAVLAVFSQATAAEYVKNFKISEGVPLGSRIGFIGESEPGRPKPPGPPYLVVPSGKTSIKKLKKIIIQKKEKGHSKLRRAAIKNNIFLMVEPLRGKH